MNRYEAAQRLDELERLIRGHGYAPGKSGLSLTANVEVIGGRLLIDPDPYVTDLLTNDQYRILYVSADGLRSADVTVTSGDEIIALLRVESLPRKQPTP
jgi:hypothetical protein